MKQFLCANTSLTPKALVQNCKERLLELFKRYSTAGFVFLCIRKFCSNNYMVHGCEVGSYPNNNTWCSIRQRQSPQLCAIDVVF